MSRDYEVGYGRPPKHSRFEKGKSGNPKGRPKGAKNIATIMNAALAEKVTVRANGRTRRMTRGQCLVEVAFQEFLKGNRSGMLLLRLMQLCGSFNIPSGTDEQQRSGVLVVPPSISKEDWEKRMRDYQTVVDEFMKGGDKADDKKRD
jgi:hypothetical protein